MNKLLRLIAYCVPSGIVWQWQKRMLRKMNAPEVIRILRHFHPGNLQDVFGAANSDKKADVNLVKRILRAGNPDDMLSDWRRFSAEVEMIWEAFRLVRPHTAENAEKIRIGGNADGGYVMLDPGRDGIAYSFGVSAFSPWDLDMAERGFKVFQYDGTVEGNPHPHPNIFFHRHNIDGSPHPARGTKSLAQIIADHAHQDQRDIVLQMDIENAEWDFFEYAAPGELKRFSQIIVELHNLTPLVPGMERKLAILRKLRETHVPIHVHMNNAQALYGPALGTPPAPSLLEVAYARKGDYIFSESREFFPTSLDCPNVAGKNDVKIGSFFETERSGNR